MSMKPLAAALCAALGLVIATSAHAGPYPVQSCVSAKMKLAATKCKADLKAWSKWEVDQDSATRDAALAASATKLGDGWTKAEAKSLAKGSDCVETTATSADESTAIQDAIAGIAADLNTGLTLGNTDDGKCGGAVLKAASSKCNSLLKAQSTHMKKLVQDASGAGLTAALTKATSKFSAKVGALACAANAANTEGLVDSLSDSVVSDTTTAPTLASTWETVVPPSLVDYSNYTGQFPQLRPLCSRGTPYMYFVKRGSGADANKLLMYYQGGGACWDGTTCATSTGAFDDNVDQTCVGGSNNGGACQANSACPGGVCSHDNPSLTTTGFGDLSNPDNPFRNWSAVFIAYCTGDIHWGDHDSFYPGSPPFGGYGIKHRGYENAKVAEKWAREHFVNPSEVFVTGSSAGAYGAILHGILLHDVYPASKFNVVGDAGNGVVTPTFLGTQFEPDWAVQQHLPTNIPGLNANITTLSIADLYGKSAAFFNARGSRFGQYSSAWDGGGGSQTFFYNVMVNGVLDAGSFQHSSCGWNSQMQTLAANAQTEAPANYRYFIMPGSRHTIYGSNRVYTETHGGVQTFVSWVNDMRSGGTWNNANCTGVDCSLLGSCNGGTNAGASCQHDSECPGGVCNIVDAKPAFTCSGGANNGNTCQRDADCTGGDTCHIEAAFGVCSANSTGNKAYVKCSTNADCPGGTCDTQQPFKLDGVVSCP
jgi:hypothetical protein